LSVSVASKSASDQIAEKNGSNLSGGASGGLAQPSNDTGRYQDKATNIKITVPYNWWEMVGGLGLAVVDNRLVLDARRLRGNKKTGEAVYAVLYMDTGSYTLDSTSRYTYKSRPKSQESQKDIRPWRGKIRVGPDGKAWFVQKRKELTKPEDNAAELEWLDEEDDE